MWPNSHLRLSWTEKRTGYNRDPIRTKNVRGAFSFNPQKRPRVPQFLLPRFLWNCSFGSYRAKILINQMVKDYRYSPLCSYSSEIWPRKCYLRAMFTIFWPLIGPRNWVSRLKFEPSLRQSGEKFWLANRKNPPLRTDPLQVRYCQDSQLIIRFLFWSNINTKSPFIPNKKTYEYMPTMLF